MADPKRTYGTPIGRGAPINTGRTKPGPADPETVSKYLQHMLGADKAFRAQQQSTPTGNSGGLSNTLAKGNPPVGVGGRRREAAIMDAVDKASR